MNTAKFIASVAPGAQETMKSRGIIASMTIAQAALESGWGAHAPGNNLFGIKAHGWGGSTQILKTTEYVGGKTITINDVFRAYENWAKSIEDHAMFLSRNPRYKNIIGVLNYRTACARIQEDGYATERSYAQELIGIIEKYRLFQYDTLKPQICIDFPVQGQTVNGKIKISGWAVNFSGIARVDIYTDGKHGLASLKAFSDRPDVQRIINPFGWYKDAQKSGFACEIPHGRIPSGAHSIDCAGIGKDGSVIWSSKSITVR